MPDITKSGLLAALKKIENNNFNKDLLTLNSIKTFSFKDDTLIVEVSLPILNPEAASSIKTQFGNIIKDQFADVKNVELVIHSKVTTHQDKKKDEILPEVKNTIAVASGKGGVGKSTVAVNLAVALAKDGANVGLIDADIYGPSIPLMLGITEKPAIYQSGQGMKIVPPEAYGIKTISIGMLIDDDAPVIWRGPMASGAVKQFMTDVDWGELDYLIFDMPPGTGDIQLTLVQTIPLTGAAIVTTPQEVSLIDARKALKMFERVNVPVLGIVENMSYFIAPDTGKVYDIFGSGGGEKTAGELNVPFLGGIPIDPRVRIGGDKGVPIVFDIPDSDHSKIIMDISRRLAEQVNIRNTSASPKIDISLGDE
jgi:ATP-binding protein involved in chromosome partitioning